MKKMKVCDLCNMSIGDDSIRYSSSLVKKAVRAGLSPAVCHLEYQKGLTGKAYREIWTKQILEDNQDWFLCPECAVRFEKFLSEQKEEEMSEAKNKTFFIAVFFGSILQTASCSGGQIQPHENQESYQTDCEEFPVSELTEGAEDFKGELIKIAGQVVVYYEKEGAKHLIIAVKDEVFTLPSGLLPVYIYYDGSTTAFINDKIEVYGEVFGYDVCPSPQIRDKELPRVDAKYIEIIQ